MCIGSPVIILKGENLWVPEGVDLRLRMTDGIAFGPGYLESLYKFCQLSLSQCY